MLILSLVAIPLLGGSPCACFFSSGGGSSDSEDKDERAGLVVIVSNGNFVDAPVEGVNYESGSLAGITGRNGEFQYEVGNSIRFFIGDIISCHLVKQIGFGYHRGNAVDSNIAG